MAGNHSRRLNILLAAGSVLVTIVLLATAGEIAARYHERHRTSVPGSKPFLYYRHNRLRHAYVRNADYFGWSHTNAQGFRGSAPTALDARGAYRIMVVGASTTADEFVTRDSLAWPAQLGAVLSRQSGGRPIEVINAGVGGYVLLDNLIRLQTDLYRYRPDLLLLYHGHNELFSALVASASSGPADARNPMPGAIEPITPWRAWLEGHSLLYAKLVARWRAIRWAGRGRRSATVERTQADWQTVLDSGTAGFGRDLDAFLAVARTHQLPVALMELAHISPPLATDETAPLIAPRWRATVPTASPAVVLEGYRRYNAVIRAAAARFGLPVVRTSEFGLIGAAWYSPGDPIHFNDAGATRMAEQMARALADARLVPPVTAVPAPR